MSETKWTPGPWRLREHPVTDDCFVEADGSPDMPYKLDVCGDDYTGHGEDEARKANMRLIAAAPELYEALDIIVAIFENLQGHKGSVLEKAHAALAKARGES